MLAAGKKTVTAAGTAEQLASDVPVKESTPITIKWLKDNTGDIYVSYSQTAAQTAATRYSLESENDLVVVIGVKNLNEIWIDAEVNGESCCYTCATFVAQA